jgi:hypothetical protein
MAACYLRVPGFEIMHGQLAFSTVAQILAAVNYP